ncbi:MAG: MoaD/ThiS family protein [Candidatus Rokubacteria bacterium]|nr:MoaD/ThiS family protein [Candidatus Rokubacteria bacterium]
MTQVETQHTTVEVVGWVTRFVGGDGSGRREYTEAFVHGVTVRQLLRRVSARYPELDEALWDATRKELGEHIEVLVNDAVLDISHTLDSELKPGDRITLIGQFMGG